MSRSAPEAPKVSVVIPCYNLGAYLDEAVQSVLAQSVQDFEIIVVDDGSTDAGTRALLAGYERPRTTILRSEHRGLAAARNLGIASSRGEYLCALDADDRLHESFLANTVRVLDGDPSVTFVSTWLRTFGSEEWDWKPERCDLPTLLWEDTVLTAALVRRTALAEADGYDSRMPVQGDEDWDLWLTLVERGHRGVILPEVLFHYRRRPGSMSTICWRGPGHLPLADYRINKHEGSFRTHLFDVLAHQDEETSALLRRNDVLERYITSELEPAVEMRRAELAILQKRLTALQVPVDAAASPTAPAGRHDADDNLGLSEPADAMVQQLAHLEASLRTASAEVLALRTSKSWRITWPLRRVYDWWLQLRGPA